MAHVQAVVVVAAAAVVAGVMGDVVGIEAGYGPDVHYFGYGIQCYRSMMTM